MKGFLIGCVHVLLMGLVSPSQAQGFVSKPVRPFKNGEKVAFLGNSITRGGTYHTYLKLFYLTRFPEMNVEMVNVGVSGDKSSDGINRLSQDVFVHQPDKIVMMWGMNDMNADGGEGTTDQEKEAELQKRLAAYRTNMDSISRKILAEGIELIYIAPSIYDDKVETATKARYGGNRSLGLCRDVVYELAKKYNSPVVDFYTIMNQVNDRFQKEDPTFTVVGADRVHPGREGHLLMGYQFIQSQNPPSPIFSAEIDAISLEAKAMENCRVADIGKIEGQVFFSLKAKSLPFPIEDNKAASWLSMHEALNQENLKVNGLESGKYELTIDDSKIGVFSSEELKNGINLADFPATPQYKQAVMLRGLVFQQQSLIANKLRALSIFDYGMLKTLPRNASPEVIDETFGIKLEEFKTRSYYNYLKLQSYKYRIYKPLTKETEDAIDRISKSLQLLNKPLTHMYLLKKLEGQ